MHFLITGHTGFKGAWLSLLLHERQHQVSGIALEPEVDALFKTADVGTLLENDIRCDIRNSTELEEHFKAINPDVVIHMAAQSLVRQSYDEPMATFDTNVIGTINVLKASQQVSRLQAQLIITTDKVYKNFNKVEGYTEGEALGGNDPYSASKAMADIATQSWIASFENAPTAIARAGNVIGGGDVCTDRLIPDLVKSYSLGLTPKLRAPNSVRPWQHVLDCLNGYLTLVDAILDGRGFGSWNFGPDETQIRTVADVSEIAGEIWGAKLIWEKDENQHPHEASFLLLNSNKARIELGWEDKLSFEESIKWTMDWYKNVREGKNPLDETMRNIRDFESR
ncbi:CDP-glucose 4,6-dehydratase [Actinomycetes bacterium]|nr:CDP-glucose 4,6-dehydratase [Actinomycetes bacterium]